LEHPLRPFLIVGCGGSGGITLQFLMDQLRADLGQQGIDHLPAAWQFVHVDVPVVADGVGPGLPRVVSEQGGRYVGLASPGSTFPTVSSALSRDLQGMGRLAELATWHADPQRVPAPIVAGAGQMRAVGRVVTLSGIKRLQEQLGKALDGLRAVGVTSELKGVARIMSPDTEGQADSGPVVLVVSSMAGGAGASMVLDVCRLLSQLPGCDPALTGLFLYTPEIFDSLPADKRNGVPGNALALTGELIASQLGAATQDDVDILEALGLGRPPQGRGIPFGRVIPIGARVGVSGALFGDGKLNDIYRGVGRGLAALMLSGQATNDWVNYDLTNNAPRPGTQVDFGWSATQKDLQWGSFGFATLSTGRDRYGEYAAQRVARAAVVRLVRGHRESGNPATDLEQRDKRVNEVYEEFCSRLGLPGPEGTQTWLMNNQQTWSRDQGWVATRTVAQRFGQDTADASRWLAVVEHHIRNDAPFLHERIATAAYERVHGWHRQVMASVEEECRVTSSTYGLPVLVGLLKRVAEASEVWVRDLQEGRRFTKPDLAILPPDVRARAASLNGKIDGKHQIVQVTTAGYAELAGQAALGELLELLAEVLASLRSDLLEPLKTAATDAVNLLQAAVDAPLLGGDLAQLRTDKFAEWPEGGQPVPARFTHAQNEVLLIDASTFHTQFEAHLTATTRAQNDASSGAGQGDGLATAIREVALDRWESTTTQAREGLLERLATWRPAALPHDPKMPDRVPARRGQYRFAVGADELLSRARNWVGRPNLPFDEFMKTSLRDYVAGADVSESQRAERTREVQTRFEQVLELAQPLVDVDSTLLSVLHDDQSARVGYKFSEVPFGGLTLGSDLARTLEQRPHVDSGSITNLNRATKALSDKTRIDVFGSYAPLSPLAFGSLLGPLARGWAGAVTPQARAAFWYHRRARRLAGGVAMSAMHRRAVVGGWFVARYTGRLRFPGEHHALRTADVYDDNRREWVPFPYPLVVPQDVLDRSPNNLLPAVLLSYGVALAQSSAAGNVDPLRPYTLLRQLWDASDNGRAPVDHNLLDARRRLQEWLRSEVPPEGSPVKARNPRDPDDARLELLERTESLHTHLGVHYMPPGVETPGGGNFSVPERESDVHDYPLFHEVAPDVYYVASELLVILRDEQLVKGPADPFDDDGLIGVI
jgi:Tubulin like